jgi:hypothetical protein
MNAVEFFLSFLQAARRVEWGACLGIYKFGLLREDSRLATTKIQRLMVLPRGFASEHKDATIVLSTTITGSLGIDGVREAVARRLFCEVRIV